MSQHRFRQLWAAIDAISRPCPGKGALAVVGAPNIREAIKKKKAAKRGYAKRLGLRKQTK